MLFVVGDGEGDVGVGLEEGQVGLLIMIIIFFLKQDVQGNLYPFENTFEVF